MKLIVAVGDFGGHKVLNAMAEPLLLPIGASGSGFGPLRVPVCITTLQHLQQAKLRHCCAWLTFPCPVVLWTCM